MCFPVFSLSIPIHRATHDLIVNVKLLCPTSKQKGVAASKKHFLSKFELRVLHQNKKGVAASKKHFLSKFELRGGGSH